MKKILLFILAFLLYNAVVFYLGWNVYSFKTDLVGFQQPIVFSIVWLVIAYSVFIGRASLEPLTTKVARFLGTKQTCKRMSLLTAVSFID